MEIAATRLSLAALDRLDVPDLVAFVGAERPLRGLAGWADWRLCGELTRLVKAGRFSGAAGEALLTVTGGRLPAGRIFLFGLGPKPGPAETWLAPALAAVARAGGTAVGVEVPGSAPLAERSRALQAAARAAGLARVVLLHEEREGAAERTVAGTSDTVAGLPLGQR